MLFVLAEDVIDDGEEVGEGFAGAGAGRDGEAAAGEAVLEGFVLMPVETQVEAEEASGVLVDEAGGGEFFEGVGGFELGGDLQVGIGPEATLLEFVLDELTEARLGNLDAGFEVLTVRIAGAVVEGEGVEGNCDASGSWAARGSAGGGSMLVCQLGSVMAS